MLQKRGRIVTTGLTLLCLLAVLNAQPGNFPAKGVITGTVLDTLMKKPIEYANVILFSARDSSQVTGTITGVDGRFSLTDLRPGVYYLDVRFIGFHKKVISRIILRPGKMKVDLGEILLREAILDMKPIEVVAEKVPIEYKIDKKVINVSKQYTAISGSAVDVLENLPSVQVDIEGNVTLRGSGNFLVLIDGRPSVLDNNEALQQIPATSIENIEIITNPSAKYDPEGTAGIINVVLKKGKFHGTSLLSDLKGGEYGQYGLNLTTNYRRKTFNITLGANLNNHVFPANLSQNNITSSDFYSSHILSSGGFKFYRKFSNLRAALEFTPTISDVYSLGFRFGNRDMQRNSTLDYEKWSEPDSLPHFFYISKSKMERGGDFYEIFSTFLHEFKKEGHKISGNASYSSRSSDEKTIDQLLTEEALITRSHKFTQSGPSKRFRLELDYNLPFNDVQKIEMGFRLQRSNSWDNSSQFDYDTTSGDYTHLGEFDHKAKYQSNIQSLYSQYSNRIKKFGYQLGLRGEYTYRNIDFYHLEQDTVYNFKIDRWDVFPSFHFSYQFFPGTQLMASYTRRIHRPRGWFLEPYETWMDAYNIRRGNPGLDPEYIDSYDFGFQTMFGPFFFSLEGFHRVSQDKIERIKSSYPGYENVTLHTFSNVGKDFSTGLEVTVNLRLRRWWTLNLMVDAYHYKVTGKLFQQDFSRQSKNWGLRLNNMMKFKTGTSLQLNLFYNSPSVSSQGEREGFLVTNLGLKQSIINNKLHATLQVRDIFGTGKHEYTTSSPDYYSHSSFTPNTPIFTFTLTYNFNNYQREKDRTMLENGNEGMDEFQF